MLEPRSTTICQQVAAAMRATGTTERSFADAVVTTYHTRTALHERSVEFHAGGTADTYESGARANAQLLRRMLAGDVRMPVDLEEAIVLSMPLPYRQRCLSQLAGRYDLLAVPLPALTGGEQHAQVADMMREAGDVLQALAPMLADGQINTADRPHAAKARRELHELLTVAMALQHTITAATRGVNVHPLTRSNAG